MNTNRRHAVAALIAAGLLWGTSVPLSKLALAWLSPGWLIVTRFGLAAAVLLAVAGRPTHRAMLRAAFTPKVLVSGALGYGGSVMVQNAGISRAVAPVGAEALAPVGAGLPALADARPGLSAAGPVAHESGTLPNRGVLSKSHIGPCSPTRRLRIEATYPLGH